MADIFISYSQADRDKVLLLSSYLEAEGWTVWWDNRLEVGDTFRDEIMRELARARAVVVVWTPNSITSDFVRAEAGRAKADGKLIPVKSDVEYRDIPLPFGEMHTEDLSKREMIRAALVAQLAKPEVQPSAWWTATRTLRYQLLTWAGIVGGVLSLFANLRGALDLADWARVLVTHWHEWAALFWAYFFRVPPSLAPLCSFVVFMSASAVGARKLSSGSPTISIKTALIRGGVSLAVSAGLLAALVLKRNFQIAEGSAFAHVLPPILALWLVLNMTLPTSLAIDTRSYKRANGEKFLAHRARVVKHMAPYVLLTLIQLVFLFVIVVLPMVAYGKGAPPVDLAATGPLAAEQILVIAGIVILPTLMSYFALAIAPLESLVKRWLFVIIGFAILVVLNAISLHGPEIRALLKPPV